MDKGKFIEDIGTREVTVSLDNILDNSKANSGGNRDLNFLRFLLDNNLLVLSEAVLKRSNIDINEEYYLQNYKKMSYESDRHFLCRAIIQEELKNRGIHSSPGIDVGNMNVLKANSNYDIVTDDFSTIIDIGLTPARNFFRGLTDFRVKSFIITAFFDDYMDDIIFSVFNRPNDQDFLNAVKDYCDGFKQYVPSQIDNYIDTDYVHHSER